MARTTIEGGCKAVIGNSAIDTNGYGKVTIICPTSGSIAATGGETSDLGTDIKDKIVDPTTGKVVSSAGEYQVLAYTGALRFVKVTGPANAVVLLSEPRHTN